MIGNIVRSGEARNKILEALGGKGSKGHGPGDAPQSRDLVNERGFRSQEKEVFRL